MCFPSGEFKIGGQDVRLGEIAGCPFYIGGAQFEYWRHTQLIIDVVPGRGAGFSVEAPEGSDSSPAAASSPTPRRTNSAPRASRREGA